MYDKISQENELILGIVIFMLGNSYFKILPAELGYVKFDISGSAQNILNQEFKIKELIFLK